MNFLVEMDQHLPPPDTYCSVCNDLCVLECLKCNKCKSSIHVVCSQLPVYAIVNFFNTRSQYVCNECVKLDRDNEAFALVINLIDREKENKSKKVIDHTGENSQVNASDDSEDAVPLSSSHDPQPPQQQKGKPLGKQDNNQRPATKVCYYYRNSRCKYGRSGRDCPFEHPRLCNYYKTNGLDPIKGCKEGNKCPFLHPPICPGSSRRRECLDLECRKLHLKGTRRYLLESRTGDLRYKHPTTSQQPPNTRFQPRTTHTITTNSSPGCASTYTEAVSGNYQQPQAQHSDPTVSFLVQQMQQMQVVQQQILQTLRSQPWQLGATLPQASQQQPQCPFPSPSHYIK